MESLPPHVIGRFFLVQQYLRGQQSFWWPYIQTLPQPEHLASWTLPPFWPEEDLRFLHGTNAEFAVQEVQANVRREFKQARKLLKEAAFPGWQDYSRLLYNWACCIFTSRSFRPTTVLSEQLRKGARHILPRGCGFDDFSILMPVLDLANHSLTAKVTWDTTSDPSCCQFVSHDPCRPGQQIYNNYGMKTNSELLLGYGFVITEQEELHNDYIHLRKRSAEEEAGNTETRGPALAKDFLVSLRPMLDPSSIVGRARLRTGVGEAFEVLPTLAHIEEALVWDLALAQAGQDERLRELLTTLLGESPGGGDIDYCLRRILASPTRPDLAILVEKIKTALLAKFSFDYDRLCEAEHEEQELELQPRNQNQELAAFYRRQCKRVLTKAIQSVRGEA
jgi:hypothetical protein